jgi:hypothetical protein
MLTDLGEWRRKEQRQPFRQECRLIEFRPGTATAEQWREFYQTINSAAVFGAEKIVLTIYRPSAAPSPASSGPTSGDSLGEPSSSFTS